MKYCKCKVKKGRIVDGWNHLQCLKCKLPILKINVTIKETAEKKIEHILTDNSISMTLVKDGKVYGLYAKLDKLKTYPVNPVEKMLHLLNMACLAKMRELNIIDVKLSNLHVNLYDCKII